MSRTRVSALVVTYNHGRYVAEALRSALAQSYPVDEVVVVDDGSDDDTLHRARSIVDPRVRVLELPHRGIDALAETYNAGLRACAGDLVAILEGDDRWPQGKLELQVPAFADPGVVLSHGLYAVIGAQGTLLHSGVGPSIHIPRGAYDPRPYVFRASYIMPVTAVIRRDSLLEIGGFRQAGVHGDYATFLALAERGWFHFQPVVLGEWRRHSTSLVYRLAGLDVEGFDRSVKLALEARSRATGEDLPSLDDVRRSWADAYARMIWQSARIYLLNRRHAEARRFLLPALRRSCSLRMRARLLLATVAAVLRVDLEPLARLVTGRSVFAELD